MELDFLIRYLKVLINKINKLYKKMILDGDYKVGSYILLKNKLIIFVNISQ